jgi:hypothetical protein
MAYRDHKALKYDVFISYRRDDADWCRKIANRLKKMNIIVWPDEPSAPEANTVVQIEETLRASRQVLIVMTPEYFAFDKDRTADRTWVELACALLEKPDSVVPLLREDCEMPPLLRNLASIDFRREEEFDDRLEELKRVLMAHASKTSSSPSYQAGRFEEWVRRDSIGSALPSLPRRLTSRFRRRAYLEQESIAIGREHVLEKLHTLVTPDEAQRWLNTPIKILEGRRPVDLISDGEAGRVFQLLVRLEEGIHA